ncbi:hypothetical protein Tco_0286773 [Tanacetum coccineum]
MSGNTTNELLVKLLDRLGLNNKYPHANNTLATVTNNAYQPVALHTSNPATYNPGPFGYYAPFMAQQLGAPHGFSYLPAQLPFTAQQLYYSDQHAMSPAQQGDAVTIAQPTQPASSGPMVTSGQATTLLNAFTAGTPMIPQLALGI